MAHVLLTGASGFLGARLTDALLLGGHVVFGTFHEHAERAPARERFTPLRLDLADPRSIETAFRAAWPEVVLHTAALSELKACETDPERAEQVNVAGTDKLARLAAAFGSRFVFFSTDQVFDGNKSGWVETDLVAPVHVYGKTKADAEAAAWRQHPSATVLRLALLFGNSPSGDRSAHEKILFDLRGGKAPRLFVDEFRTPVLVDDVVRITLDLLATKDLGLLHVGGPDRVSRHEFGFRVAQAFGLPPERIEAVRLDDVDAMPRRPRDLSLDTRKLAATVRSPPRGIDDALALLAEQTRAPSP